MNQHKNINKNGYINVEQIYKNDPEEKPMPTKLLFFLGNYCNDLTSDYNTGYMLEYENEDREVIQNIIDIIK